MAHAFILYPTSHPAILNFRNPIGRLREIWEFAKAQDFCIVTQDADFADRSRLYGSPPKVIWLRCGNAPTSNVEAILRSGAETIQEFMGHASLDCLELY